MTAGMTVATIRAMIIRLVQDILWNFFCMGILLFPLYFAVFWGALMNIIDIYGGKGKIINMVPMVKKENWHKPCVYAAFPIYSNGRTLP